jgi:hypothetical protein
MSIYKALNNINARWHVPSTNTVLDEATDIFFLMFPGRLFHKVGVTNLKALWP